MAPLNFRESHHQGWYQSVAYPSLWYCPHWLALFEASTLFDQLDHSLEWEQPTLTLFGKTHRIPRSQCWVGDSGLTYRYSNKTFHPQPWPDFLREANQRINDAVMQLSLAEGWPSPKPMNSMLANRYRGGTQKMGWHSDDEAELGPDPIIASLSLGESRDMRFRPTSRFAKTIRNDSLRAASFPLTLQLTHGSLLIMGPGSQRDLQHEIPQRKKAEGSRINLTFRHIIPE